MEDGSTPGRRPSHLPFGGRSIRWSHPAAAEAGVGRSPSRAHHGDLSHLLGPGIPEASPPRPGRAACLPGVHPRQRPAPTPAVPTSLGRGQLFFLLLTLGWICNLTVTMETQRSGTRSGGKSLSFWKLLSASKDTGSSCAVETPGLGWSRGQGHAGRVASQHCPGTRGPCFQALFSHHLSA